MASANEVDAMLRAVDLAIAAGPTLNRNPRVGCVIISSDGVNLGEGFHHGPGHPHAEVEALAAAGSSASGATAIVTLEPCRHVGLTGPCTRALIDSGISRVVFGQIDPNPEAAGGASELEAAGLSVEGGVQDAITRAINLEWSTAVARQTPFVTLKLAASLDGKVAAADGSSRWISGPESRDDAHLLRSRADAIVVGTGTVIEDDPELTDRRKGATRQPMRVVVGHRAIPETAKVRGGAEQFRQIRSHDLVAMLSELYSDGSRHVLVEAGPTLASAFIRERLVDRLVWYVAPMLLGEGRSAIEELGIGTIDNALHWRATEVKQLGDDLRLELVARH